MRLPPDVVALLIKIKDYFLVLGPALLVAVSLKTILLAVIHTRNSERSKPLEQYLQASSAISSSPFTLFSPQWLWLEQAVNRLVFSLKNLWLEAGALVASPAALFTALVLSPILFIVRIAVGIALGLLGRAKWSKFRLTINTTKAKTITPKKNSKLKTTTTDASVNPWQPANLFKAWLGEFDLYLGWGLYNFLLAALLTIFVPLRTVENWFGPGQFLGPILIPLLALLLVPATGSEMALVLALFTKGASTGSGVAALLTFPLLTVVGLVEWQRRYGLKATIIFALLIWSGAAGLGLIFDVVGINANV